MSYVDDLIDLNGFQKNCTYTDSPDDEIDMKKSYSNNEMWSENKPDLLFDTQCWSNEYDTEKSGMAQLVSSEENIISTSGSSSPRLVNGGGTKTITTFNWYRDNQSSMNNDSNMDELEDGFASRDVLTVGDCPVEINSGENQVPSMADHWGNTDYDTVLRTSGGGTGPKNDAAKFVNPSISKNKTQKLGINKDSLCTVCNCKVYMNEKLVFDKRLLHKKCFKCTVCNGALRMNNAASLSNQLYCDAHFTEAINRKDRPSPVVVTDINAHEELPPQQITKNTVEKFRQLESRKDAEYLRPKRHESKRQNKCSPSVNRINLTPENRKDNSLANSLSEMPTPGTTKNLLNHWNSVSGSQRQNTLTSTKAREQTPRMNIMHNAILEKDTETAIFNGNSTEYALDLIDNIQHAQIPSSIPYSPPTTIESQAIENPVDTTEVEYESNSIDQSDELPPAGLTRNLVGFFQSLKKD